MFTEADPASPVLASDAPAPAAETTTAAPTRSPTETSTATPTGIDSIRGGRLLLLAIVALGLGLRLPGYTESIWLDELFTSRLYCGDPIILLKTLFSDTHPPAYFVFIHFWIAAFGDSEIWLRLPPMLCGLLSIPLIARIGSLFGGPATGLMAAFLLAVSPVHIWYSQEARPYSANIFLLLLTILAYYRLTTGQLVRSRSRIVWRTVFFFALLCVVFTHYYVVTFPFALSALVLLRQTENRKSIIASCVLVVALVAAYMGAKAYFSDVPTGMHYLRSFDLAELWRLFFEWFSTGNSFNPIDNPTELGVRMLRVVQGMTIVAALIGVWRLCSKRSASTQAPGGDVVLLLIVVPVFLLILTAIGKDKTYIERSALPSLPFFLLLIAAGLTGFRQRWFGGIAIGMTVATFALVLTAYFTNREHWTVYKPNPDWRAATELISADIGQGAESHLYSNLAVPAALTYYDARIQQAKHFEPNGAKTAKVLERTAHVFGTEGFPGAAIQGFIGARLDAYRDLLEETRKQTRMWVHYLGDKDPLTAAPPPREFWLLVHREASDRSMAIVNDPRTEVVLDRSFLSLRIYRLRVKAQ